MDDAWRGDGFDGELDRFDILQGETQPPVCLSIRRVRVLLLLLLVDVYVCSKSRV